MFYLFKKAFRIVCEDIMFSPTVPNIHEVIAKFCGDNGYAFYFRGDNEVVIAGIPHEISYRRSASERGRYVIRCREK